MLTIFLNFVLSIFALVGGFKIYDYFKSETNDIWNLILALIILTLFSMLEAEYIVGWDNIV
jgi:drug/metabolite transporter superfamily protein YnfA